VVLSSAGAGEGAGAAGVAGAGGVSWQVKPSRVRALVTSKAVKSRRSCLVMTSPTCLTGYSLRLMTAHWPVTGCSGRMPLSMSSTSLFVRSKG
jgi:hypothetical protein